MYENRDKCHYVFTICCIFLFYFLRAVLKARTITMAPKTAISAHYGCCDDWTLRLDRGLSVRPCVYRYNCRTVFGDAGHYRHFKYQKYIPFAFQIGIVYYHNDLFLCLYQWLNDITMHKYVLRDTICKSMIRLGINIFCKLRWSMIS